MSHKYPSMPLTWTYRLEWERRDAEEYSVVMHCQSDAGYKAEITIEVRSGWLQWGVNSSVPPAVRKRYGGSGLMKPVIAAIHTVLGLFLKEQQPDEVQIVGSGEKRSKLYRSWTAWQFPGYTSEDYAYGGDYGGGITFSRIEN